VEIFLALKIFSNETPLDEVSHFWETVSFKLHVLHAAQLFHKANKKNVCQNS